MKKLFSFLLALMLHGALSAASMTRSKPTLEDISSLSYLIKRAEAHRTIALVRGYNELAFQSNELVLAMKATLADYYRMILQENDPQYALVVLGHIAQ